MTAERTPDGKVVLFLKSTGQRFERWPVDAREMMNTGDYSHAPIEDEPEASPNEGEGAPVGVAPLPENLADMTKAELVDVGATLGLTLDKDAANKAALLEAIQAAHAAAVASAS